MQVKPLTVPLLFVAMALNGAALAEQIKIQNVHYDSETNLPSVKAKIDGHHHGQASAGDAYVEILDAANPDLVLSALHTPKQIHSQIDAASLPFLPCQGGIVVNGDTANMVIADVKKCARYLWWFRGNSHRLVTDEPMPLFL